MLFLAGVLVGFVAAALFIRWAFRKTWFVWF